MDGINYEIIKNMPIKLHLILLDIYNEMNSSNSFPDSWKETFIHFIEKPNKSGMRPIALTSCLCKLFKIMTTNRLLWWTENRNLLPKSHSGFRKGRSCADNLTDFTFSVQKAFSNKQHVLAAFLDVHSAFPSVNNDILLSKLAKVGCSQKMISFVKFLTYERLIHIDILQDNHRKVYKGVLQGGPLSAISYMLYVSEITDGLSKLKFHNLLMT